MEVHSLLSQATCSVIINGNIVGTAWLVHDGYLLTAGHVLGKKDLEYEVYVRFGDEQPIKASIFMLKYEPNQGIDFAVLNVDIPNNNQYSLPIALITSLQPGSSIISYGFGKTLKHRSAGGGKFIGIYSFQNSTNFNMFEVESNQLGEQGYSGAAIYSQEANAVVAIQTSTTGQRLGVHSGTVLTMPLYRIAEYWNLLYKIQHLDPILITDEMILRVLYNHFESFPFARKLPLGELAKYFRIKTNQHLELIYYLIRLKENGLIDYEITSKAKYGFVWITADGIKIVRSEIDN